jgi:hypothetical protein
MPPPSPTQGGYDDGAGSHEEARDEVTRRRGRRTPSITAWRLAMLSTLRPIVVALTLVSSVSFSMARTPEAADLSTSTSPPTATILFRHVAANRTIKPRGAPLNQPRATSVHATTADMRLSRALRTTICTGCLNVLPKRQGCVLPFPSGSPGGCPTSEPVGQIEGLHKRRISGSS